MSDEETTRFEPHPVLETSEVGAVNSIRMYCKDVETIVLDRVPKSRERSLALTKLEEVLMWSEKAIEKMGLRNV